MTKCPHCSKTYKSKSGLRRHINSIHPNTDEAVPQEEPVTDDQDADDLMAERDVIHAPDHLTLVAPSDKEPLDAALKALAIEPDNVMSYRVYPDKVVLIEGPVGWKRVWPRKES